MGASVRKPVAYLHHINLHVVILFDLLRDSFEGLGKYRSGFTGLRVGSTEEPSPKFTFLPTSQGDHLTGMVGLFLDYRKRLQNRVVKMLSHLGSGVGSYACSTFRRQVAAHPEKPGPSEEDEAERKRQTGGKALAKYGERTTRGHKRAKTRKHQQRSERNACKRRSA